MNLEWATECKNCIVANDNLKQTYETKRKKTETAKNCQKWDSNPRPQEWTAT